MLFEIMDNSKNNNFFANQSVHYYAFEFMQCNEWIFNQNVTVSPSDIEAWWWRSHPLYGVPTNTWREKLPGIINALMAFLYFDTSNSKPF